MGKPRTARGVVWPCVDLGGTSLRLLMVKAAAPGSRGEAVVRLERRTPRGVGPLLQALREVLASGCAQAAELGFAVVPALAMGTPGRYRRDPDGRRRLAPHSATSLEASPGEFHDLDPLAVLSAGLELPEDRIFVDNDAVAQGLALVQQGLDDELRLRMLGECVVCLNPGTGLGGCVAQVDDEGRVEVFTDGHVSEISLHPFAHDGRVGAFAVHLCSTAHADELWLQLDDGESTRELALPTPAGKQAEDLIAGVGVARILGGLDRALATDAEPSPLREAARQLGLDPAILDGALISRCLDVNPTTPAQELATEAATWIADLAAAALVGLMRRLRAGQPRKTPRFPDWSDDEVRRIRGVRRFIVGGGIAQHALGRHLVDAARKAWAQLDPQVLIHTPARAADAGALGALLLVPAARRAELEGMAR